MWTALNCPCPRDITSPLGTDVEITEDWLGSPHKRQKELLKTHTIGRMYQPNISINSAFKSKYLNGKSDFICQLDCRIYKEGEEPIPLLENKNNLTSGNDFAAWSPAMPILD